MSLKRPFHTTANNLKNNEITNVNLSEQLNRFERDGCELLLEEPKLVERFFTDPKMNDLRTLIQFFQFLQRSISNSRHNAIKLVLRLPGSTLLTFAYDHLKPSPDEGEKAALEKFVLVLSKVLRSLLGLHPSCWEQLDSMGIFDRLETYSLKNTNEEVLLELTTLISQGEKLREQMIKKQKANVQIQPDRDDPPPDDFHQLSIYPTLAEISQQQIPYLRRNITKGQYKDGTHYLDIHFRLLREDFLWPLREAICQFISEDNRDISFRNSNVRVYRNTILKGTICSTSGMLFSLVIDSKTLSKSISWSNSQRLIYGNLFAATFDNFVTSCFLLTVENRSDIDKNGTIHVRCQKELCNYKLMRISPGTPFILLETTFSFEAYRPILQALQNITDDRLPLEKYLLHCEKDVTLPNYFLQKSDIDFRSILVKSTGLANEFDGGLSNVKDLSTWPNAEQLGLDDSQYKALQLAITKSVALIQGPPGCGKTFLGVRLAEFFYHNRKGIIGCERPILMICYTNHALDQFLSSIIGKLSLSPGQIVRVGGRSTHPDIEPFLIQKLRQQRRDVRVKYEIINNLRKQIDDCQEKYYRCTQQLLDINQLLQVMEKNQFLTFIKPILYRLDIFHRHWRLSKGGIYCCKSIHFNARDEDESVNDELDTENASSVDKQAVRMRNRIYCHKLNQLSANDQYKINHFFIKWLGATHLDIMNQIRRENKDHGEGEFETQRKKQNKEIKDKAAAVLKDIRSDSILTIPNESNRNDEEESRRLGHIDNSYKVFTIPNQRNEKDEVVNTEQLQCMQRLLHNKTALLSDDVVKNLTDLWSSSIDKQRRQALYRYWLWKYVQLLTDEWFLLNEQYDEVHQSIQELKLVNDRLYMENTFIIAMTTHCASRYQKVLKQIAPRICIVEEAAEVFESHIITAIGEGIEHLILIGDHIQLRPSPNVYTLAKKFNLDVSLFERLIKNEMPSVQLCVQHRSIPIISSLTHHFYDIPIRHHDSVHHRPSIIGVTHPLYFINHDHFEENVVDGASKRNLHESNYVLQLANYLINQGYEKSEITILTTYMGQRQLIQKTINQSLTHLKGIHVTVVDNFQGEENRIVLLSLVRSNVDKRLGYVAVDNRICVALSRAQNGFYIIGNFNLFMEHNKTWKTIVDKIEKLNLIGAGLPIHCANHLNNQLICVHPNDFLKRPLGGCGLKCETRLSCGHQCPLTCHSTSHNLLVCQKTCLNKYDDCEHQCQEKFCHAPKVCPPCRAMVTIEMSTCKHTSEISCTMRKTNQPQCPKLVPYTCPIGHQVQVRCCDLGNKEFRDRLCSHPCDFTLECGHPCKGTCSTCLQGRFHHPCNQEELVIYICGHSRPQRCHLLGPRCEQKYFKLCDHPDEPKIISDDNRCVLYQCNRYCLNKYKDTPCRKRCRDECDLPLCYEKCKKRFKCEHYCNGILGEPCVDCLSCRQKDSPREIGQGIIGRDLRYATFVQLECGHLFKTDVLDEHVENFKKKNFLSNGFMHVEYPRCLTCQFPMVRCKRYSSLIKKIQDAIENISEIISVDTDSEKHSYAKPLSPKSGKLPANIVAIIKQNCCNRRHIKLTNLFFHVLSLFRKLDCRTETERDKLLKTIYEYVEQNDSVFLTQQQWSDLENEYNRLLVIDHFRVTKELAQPNLSDPVIVTLEYILFGSHPFSKFACQICNLLLKQDSDNNDKWTSILPDGTEWNQFERDRRICDGKWFVCPKGKNIDCERRQKYMLYKAHPRDCFLILSMPHIKSCKLARVHLIRWNTTITEQSTCPRCGIDNDPSRAISLGRGTGFFSRDRPNGR